MGAKRGVRHLSVIPILGAIFDQNSKKGIQKGMQNSMLKKYRKLMAKGSQNDAKMEAKIFDFQAFSKKMKSMKSSPRSDGSMILQVQGT